MRLNVNAVSLLALLVLASAANPPAARAQTPTPPLPFVAISPCRAADTRFGGGPLGAPDLMAGTTRSFPILASPCGIPSNALAYSLNITVLPANGLQYLTIWPTGQPQPLASTLNAPNQQIVAKRRHHSGGNRRPSERVRQRRNQSHHRYRRLSDRRRHRSARTHWTHRRNRACGSCRAPWTDGRTRGRRYRLPGGMEF